MFGSNRLNTVAFSHYFEVSLPLLTYGAVGSHGQYCQNCMKFYSDTNIAELFAVLLVCACWGDRRHLGGSRKQSSFIKSGRWTHFTPSGILLSISKQQCSVTVEFTLFALTTLNTGHRVADVWVLQSSSSPEVNDDCSLNWPQLFPPTSYLFIIQNHLSHILFNAVWPQQRIVKWSQN
jgi:hypothetical protein